MELLCKVCSKVVFDKYIINNSNFDEIDKILNDYVNSYNKKLEIYAIRCQFFLVFDNNFRIHIETGNYFNNDDCITKIENYLLYWIDS